MAIGGEDCRQLLDLAEFENMLVCHSSSFELALSCIFTRHICDIPYCIAARWWANILAERDGIGGGFGGEAPLRTLETVCKHCFAGSFERNSWVTTEPLKRGKLWTNTLTIPWIGWVYIGQMSKRGKIINQESCLSRLVDAKAVRQFSSRVSNLWTFATVRWC